MSILIDSKAILYSSNCIFGLNFTFFQSYIVFVLTTSIIFVPEFIKTIKIMKGIVENLNQLFAEFAKDAASQVENGNKAAGARARKASLTIEKALKEFRKVSIEASK